MKTATVLVQMLLDPMTLATAIRTELVYRTSLNYLGKSSALFRGQTDHTFAGPHASR